MDNTHKLFFVFSILIVVGGFFAINLLDANNNSLYTFVDTGNSLTGLAVADLSAGGFANTNSFLSSASASNCYENNDQSNCELNNCSWHTEGPNSWCEGLSCFSADNTNQTYCEVTLNQTHGFECGWETFGSGLCDPLGGDFFGDGCADYDGDEQGCYDTYFCFWDSSLNECEEPEGGFGGQLDNLINPSCGIINDAGTCGNVTGCTWDGANSVCNGHENDNGIQCGDLNKTICSDITFLSSCCAWNGTSCGTTFQNECYNNIPQLGDGMMFCEDDNVYKNETACDQLAGSPWYMPCKWDSNVNECHFNSEAFGDEASNFDEIGSETVCEAQGGQWVSEQFFDPVSGKTKVDTWCEFKFGSGGNCDSSCWACENDADVTDAASAESVCEGSGLGYCEFISDSNSINGYGWCEPKQEFILGGGKSFNDECSAADFLNEPEQKCSESVAGCVWVNDTDAPNGIGNCFGQSEKRCGNDCFSCYDSTSCTTDGDGGNGACDWDSINYYCKPSGFSGEVCFDGLDNDGDGDIDCNDAGCATDKFCGGEALSASFGDCPSNFDNTTCISNGCVWLVDSFDEEFGGEGAGFCDFPGAQCWINDDSEAQCNNENGCSWITTDSGFCEENATVTDSCFMNSNRTGCLATEGCGWEGPSENNGFCESVLFSECFNNASRQNNQASCEQNVTYNGQSTQICGWQDFGHFQGCEPICFGLTNETCGEANGLCETVYGLCEPDSFGGNCFAADGNATMCNGELNASCSYFPDPNAGNGVAPDNVDGWCNPKGDSHFISLLDSGEPIILGEDGPDAGVASNWDLMGVGVKDTFDKFIFGASIMSEMGDSIICNGKPISNFSLGSGVLNHTYFFYIDGDGNTENGCSSRDDVSNTGYEFSFKYAGKEEASNLVETKVSYQCIDGNWAPAPIPLSATKNVVCGMIGGGMAGIDKAELLKFKSLFNKSESMRVYTTLSNVTTNDSVVADTAGPYYYSHGAFDFKFEDCSNAGGDADEDGLTASNDPDCFDFLKFGYVPNEVGFQCSDGIDNDADGLTDCSDEGCAYDPFACGGELVPDENDKTAPRVVWLEANTFPDSAFIIYDTNEPSNGTLDFYYNDSSCGAVNKTIYDNGVTDDFIPDYKMWHDGQLDNFGFNQNALGFELDNGTSYYYKTTVCDVSNNCAISACLNFTTKSSVDSCNSCYSTFKLPFEAASGTEVTDPLGNLQFIIETPDGTTTTLDANSNAGTQLNYTSLKNFNLEIKNPNASSQWCIKLINSSVLGKIDTSKLNFSDSDGDISFDSNNAGSFVGLGNTKCQELINTFRPKKLNICVPDNVSQLWQCGDGLTNCTRKDIGTNATRLLYNESINATIWEVPAEWGC